VIGAADIFFLLPAFNASIFHLHSIGEVDSRIIAIRPVFYLDNIAGLQLIEEILSAGEGVAKSILEFGAGIG
jgi:hypothetical protein